MSIATLLNIATPELMEGVPEYVGKCQTYEGGMGGFPGNEAHGGYSFCALAAAVLCKNTNFIDMPSLTVTCYPS
jgi:protein farnesyltransferase subunit beta